MDFLECNFLNKSKFYNSVKAVVILLFTFCFAGLHAKETDHSEKLISDSDRQGIIYVTQETIISNQEDIEGEIRCIQATKGRDKEKKLAVFSRERSKAVKKTVRLHPNVNPYPSRKSDSCFSDSSFSGHKTDSSGIIVFGYCSSLLKFAFIKTEESYINTSAYTASGQIKIRHYTIIISHLVKKANFARPPPAFLS